MDCFATPDTIADPNSLSRDSTLRKRKIGAQALRSLLGTMPVRKPCATSGSCLLGRRPSMERGCASLEQFRGEKTAAQALRSLPEERRVRKPCAAVARTFLPRRLSSIERGCASLAQSRGKNAGAQALRSLLGTIPVRKPGAVCSKDEYAKTSSRPRGLPDAYDMIAVYGAGDSISRAR